MKVTFTEKAAERVKAKLSNQEGKWLKLKYDTDGCGCVVSGVSALWITPEKEEDDVVLDTNVGPVLMEKSKLLFFDENMTVDFVESANSYMLKCPSQILNPRMSLSVVEATK